MQILVDSRCENSLKATEIETGYNSAKFTKTPKKEQEQKNPRNVLVSFFSSAF